MSWFQPVMARLCSLRACATLGVGRGRFMKIKLRCHDSSIQKRNNCHLYAVLWTTWLVSLWKRTIETEGTKLRLRRVVDLVACSRSRRTLRFSQLCWRIFRWFIPVVCELQYLNWQGGKSKHNMLSFFWLLYLNKVLLCFDLPPCQLRYCADEDDALLRN
jgi:hypothetical protein